MTTCCYKCLVSGRVQGVFFRAGTRAMAQELGLTGYAKNLPDGRVEVVVCGDAPAVGQMREWLWSGPKYARVTEVSCEVLDGVGFDRFSVG
jgi:acylphosphatase